MYVYPLTALYSVVWIFSPTDTKYTEYTVLKYSNIDEWQNIISYYRIK